MSTTAGLGRNRRDRIAFAVHVLVTGFCLLFSRIYLALSYGVSSPWMVWLPLAPLVLGAIPAAVMTTLDVHPLSRVAFNAWSSFVATVTAGACVAGVLEIAEATTPFVWAFALLALACGIVLLVSIAMERKHG